MATKKLTVVVSQHQGKNPQKLRLEEEIAAALIMEPDVDVSLVPHLYDMHAEHTGLLFLRAVPGDLVVLSWLYPRAARWILDRQGIKGGEGATLLKGDDEEDDEIAENDNGSDEPGGIGAVQVPDRRIYCVDFRSADEPGPFLEEIRRIAHEGTVRTVDLMQWIQGQPKGEQLQRYLRSPGPSAASGTAGAAANGNGNGAVAANENGVPANGNATSANGNGAGGDSQELEPTRRRWYPVIDYSRCTNCMECIDFCLFGVYGVDALDRILVEEQDNCKKGCPACSRVCPENAIVFPVHKTPAIAGAAGEVVSLKIDLSKLFGAPSGLDMAVRERDVELVRDGREAVGHAVGIPKRQTHPQQERDDLDDLIDGLDDLNF